MTGPLDDPRSVGTDDATPWESADIQLARVRQFVLADLVAAGGGLALLASFYVVWQPRWVWATLGAVVVSIAVLVYSLRLLSQRRLSAAVFAIAASFWFVIPAITFVLPTSFAACSLATIWPVLLATPYVDKTTLRRLAYVTFPVALLSLALSLRDDPFGVEDTLGSTVMNLSLIGIGVAFALLTLIMIWAYNSRLQETLAGLQQSNDRLAANERQLEAKVAARTTEFESVSAYLGAVIENLPQGLATLDDQGFLLERNAAFVNQFDLQSTEVTLDELPQELQDVVASIDTRRGSRSTATDEPTFISLSRNRIGKAMATPITLVQGSSRETIGAVIVIDDVTTERQVDRMKTDFISTVSHELRTPLTSVLGFARIIQKRLDEKVFPEIDASKPGTERAMRQVRENLNIILDEGGRLTSLINDVLDISKMEARQVDWNFEPVSLQSVVDTAVTATAALFEDGDVEVRVNVSADLPPVMADQQRLVQVIINLLSNAQKFTPKGIVAISASAPASGESMAKLSVGDTGIGVARDDLPLLFERFRQVGDSLTDRPTGTGLGLPICREIIEAHGGTIEASSQLDIGTTFVVRLPTAATAATAPTATAPTATAPTSTAPTSAEPAIDPVREHFADVTTLPAATPVAPGGTPHILIVDDDDGIRSLLRDLFETEGYRTSEAESGEIAIGMATNERPDLITLDVLMPGMSGIDTALALRLSPNTATVPLMFVSVLDRIPGPSLGVDAHVTKPIDVERLLRLSRELLARDKVANDDFVIVNASADVLASIVDGLERFGYERVDWQDPAIEPPTGGVRLVIANSASDAGYPELNRWNFRRGNDELVVIAFETDQTETGQQRTEDTPT